MLKLIIVEDEDIIRKGLVYTIDWVSIGYSVAREAANGEEGLALIREIQPDVVITDIRMPKMDGIAMLQEALRENSFKSLILTSYAEFDYARKAIQMQVSDYILKPVDEEKLRGTMKKLHGEIIKERETAIVYENKDRVLNLDMTSYIQLAQSENQYVAKAITALCNHYAEKINLEDIADELGISGSYLSRKFKDITGLTFLDLLNKYRIQQAIRLLNTGQYRVYEISDLAGFSDYKHFCSVFKKYMLISPTGFTKSLSSNK